MSVSADADVLDAPLVEPVDDVLDDVLDEPVDDVLDPAVHVPQLSAQYCEIGVPSEIVPPLQ